MEDTMTNWFTVDKIDPNTSILSEYRHWEETHCYLINGSEGSLLIDTGLGICDIYQEVQRLTDKPVAAVATHVHWDHLGGHKYFPEFYAHSEELNWLQGEFPLSLETIKEMVVDRCDLPEGFQVGSYEFFQGTPARLLEDNELIHLGDRQIKMLHTPGHSPGHMCFWEEETGYLFTGDLVYKDTLFAYFPSTDPELYLNSLIRIADLPVKRVFPGHHDLNIQPEILKRMRDAFLKLKKEGKLHHGSGTHNFGDWAIWL
jgi:glyoxylase-like metal-dependent hydrolase (beta-lactamase superfamily II)